MMDVDSLFPFRVRPTTPLSLDDVVSAFVLEQLGEGPRPQFVPIECDEEAIERDCFTNVERQIERYGGSRRFGWAIWVHTDAMIEAEFHSVWMKPIGELVDVTPHDDETQILFVLM
jgi:hypothetical protein